MGPWCEHCGIRRAVPDSPSEGLELCDICSAEMDIELERIVLCPPDE